jgi:hypothetical protein
MTPELSKCEKGGQQLCEVRYENERSRQGEEIPKGSESSGERAFLDNRQPESFNWRRTKKVV